MNGKVLVSLIVLFLLLALGSMSIFIVDQREVAIQFKLGEIVKADFEPGIYVQMPFINNVKKFDGRLLTLDSEEEEFLTIEKKNVIVDTFVKWKIGDPTKFYTSVNGNLDNANIRLSQIINSGLRDEFGRRTVQEVVSGERDDIMKNITEKSNVAARELGIDVRDVRVRRVELPTNINDNIFARMRAERGKVARELRAQGEEKSERIKADADRQRTVILADAYRDAEVIRGEGDASATETYAKAYGKDPEFYAFYRSLSAYVNSFANKSDVLVLEPDSEFFKYFGASQGK